MAPKIAAALAGVQLLFLITSLGLLAYIISKFTEATKFINNFNPQSAIAALSQGKLPEIPETFEVFGGYEKLGVTPAQLASGNLSALLPLLGRLNGVLKMFKDMLTVLTALGSVTLAYNVLCIFTAAWVLFAALKNSGARSAVICYWINHFLFFVFGIAFIAYTGVKSEKGTSIFYAFVAMWVLAVVAGFGVIATSLGMLRGSSSAPHSSVEMREKEGSV
ncbi:uncharacterized protein PFL1_05966 [Pseudozyma flocculosa PF-1]|uniref:Uncharacterized protein n=2 Tax=Pseudozyma flocculosa TaxID=84751 RepID=A0A5C3F1P0_9BASI|nr:uncharacterized protein PFL1_05966 [Pseudozyma flocculosa PF-1]EPQ26645.1 hypothetical protein PFL1_05966 [Pseudozyma flocculosa PF-1]SPO38358.1 uncharacterized protein PSFLO_03835 [Pseudozyma flocculosa]